MFLHILSTLGGTNSKPNEYKKINQMEKGIIFLVDPSKWIM
jgi:hypothetical protein